MVRGNRNSFLSGVVHLSLKYPLRFEGGNIVCYKCGSTRRLCVHHDHKTGELIAVVCSPCNTRIRNNEIEYKNPSESTTVSISIDTLRILKILKSRKGMGSLDEALIWVMSNVDEDAKSLIRSIINFMGINGINI